MKTIKEKRKETVCHTEQIDKEVETFICTDGVKFENMYVGKGLISIKERAERHEKEFIEKVSAKKELKYRVISGCELNYNSTGYCNEGYDYEFVFYYHDKLSIKTKSILYKLIYSNENLKDLKDGWYIVKQTISEMDSNCRSQQYEHYGSFTNLTEFVKSKKKKYDFYNSLLNEIK